MRAEEADFNEGCFGLHVGEFMRIQALHRFISVAQCPDVQKKKECRRDSDWIDAWP